MHPNDWKPTDRFFCPQCKARTPVFKWPVENFFDDGTESLSCPECGYVMHERDLYRVPDTQES